MIVRITKAPPGFAPESIREEWMGIELPALSKEQVRVIAVENGAAKIPEGYVIFGLDAVKALIDAGKVEAAAFWSRPIVPRYLEFSSDCCEEQA